MIGGEWKRAGALVLLKVKGGSSHGQEICRLQGISFRESKCTVAISADSGKELIEVAVQHGVKVHGHHDTAEFRKMLKQAIKEGSPLTTKTMLLCSASRSNSSACSMLKQPASCRRWRLSRLSR
jgi:predicted small metal-binding protein